MLLSEVGQVKGVPDELTKYFSESAHHRFSGKSALKNLENMYGPNQQLHISNVPIGVPDETVDDALRNYGDSVQTRWIGNKANSEVRTKMCIANMDSVRSAVSALIGLHTIFFAGHEPANRKGIVVSFSKRMPQRNPEPRGEGHGRNGGLIPDPTRSCMLSCPTVTDMPAFTRRHPDQHSAVPVSTTRNVGKVGALHALLAFLTPTCSHLVKPTLNDSKNTHLLKKHT